MDVLAWPAVVRFLTGLRTTFFFAYFELKKMSAGSGLGLVWAILEPLLRVSIYVFVFTVILGLRLPGASAEPFKYAIYILQGLVPWLFISSCLSGGLNMVQTYAGFIRQPAFPYRILPNLIVITRLPAHIVGMVIVFALMIAGGTIGNVNWPLLAFVYVLILVAARGMATVCGAIVSVIPDFRHIITLILMLSIYLSPILYVPSQMGPFIIVGMLNPFAYMLTSFKYALTSDPGYTMFQPAGDIGILAALALVCYLAQSWVLRRIRETGIDRVA